MSSKVITISLKEEVEKELRRLAIQKYGRTKGALSKTITKFVQEGAKKEEIDPGYAKFLEVMKKIKGVDDTGLR